MTTAHRHGGGVAEGPQMPRGWVLLLSLFAITAVGIAAVALVVSRAETPVSQEITPVAIGQAVLTSEQLGAINHLLAHESAVGAAVGTSAVLTSEQLGAINHLLAHESAVGTSAASAED